MKTENLNEIYKNPIPNFYNILNRTNFENPNNGPYSTIHTNETIFTVKHIGEKEKSINDRLQWADITFKVNGQLSRKVIGIEHDKKDKSIFYVKTKTTVYVN